MATPLVILTLLVIISTFNTSPCGAADVRLSHDVSIHDIERAWHTRETSVEYATFVWNETRTITTDYIKMIGLTTHGRDEVVHVEGVTVTLGPGKIRYQYESGNSGVAGEPRQPIETSYDGKVSAHFVPSTRYHYRGALDEYYFDLSDPSLRAILVVLRPLHKKMLNLSMNDFTLDSGMHFVGGHSCILVQQQPGGHRPGMTTSLWIDADYDYLPRRLVEKHSGTPTYQLDIEYKQEPEVARLPWKWRWMMLASDGRLLQETQVEVIDVTIETYISNDQFRIDFPPSTRIADRRTGDEYMVLEGGRTRPLDSWGEVQRSPRTSTWSWAIRINFVIACVFVLYLIIRRSHRVFSGGTRVGEQ